MMNLTNLFNTTFAHTILDTGSYPRYLIFNEMQYNFKKQEDRKYIYENIRTKDEFSVRFSKAMYGKLVNIHNTLMR